MIKTRIVVLHSITALLWSGLTSTSSAQQTLIPKPLYWGTQVSLNGQNLRAGWSQWQLKASGTVGTAISDVGVTMLGVELLNTSNAAKQPVQWFSQPSSTPIVLSSWLRGTSRYLDVTQLATSSGWQLTRNGNTLQITTPTARVKAIRQGQQPWGDRIVVDLDRPTPWQVAQQQEGWDVTIDAVASPTSSAPIRTTPTQTTIHISPPDGLSPRVSTLANPTRLVIDVRPDAMVERDILWATGLRWHQQFIRLDDSRFPVISIEISPGTGLQLKPIVSANTLVGIAPLSKTAERDQAIAAVNGGFFNRNNKLPLGAIRRDGHWLSSPILNRGAIAWNELGRAKIARLSLQETITTSTQQRLPIVTSNSGYIQAGISRYSWEWGASYTPLSDNEIIVVVENNQVTAQLAGGAAGKNAFPIPVHGYLLTLRANQAASDFLTIGTLIRQESTTFQPANFAHYPQILGAGPLLVQNRQIVLDAKAEGFSNAFIQEKAVRSAIGITPPGNLIIATVLNRVGGNGPSLAEMARLMQQLNCTDALNLDGGSSSSLYLGGQLLNRSPRTAARVHNGLGIFLAPP